MHFDFTSIESTVIYLKSFGLYGPLVAFGLFFIQAVAPVIPYIILAGAAGMIYGNLIGFSLAWSGALAGAWWLYWVSKKFNNNRLIRYWQRKYDFNIKNYNEKNIFWILLISRIFPVVPTPIINIGSGLGGVKTRTFVSSSALGKIPWAIIYVTLGNYLMKSQNIINTLLIVMAIIIISVAGIHYFNKRMLTYRKKDNAEQ